MHTVAELKESVSGLLQGTNLDYVTDLDGAIERAARTVVQQADVPEATGVYPVTLYSNVFDYGVSPNIFGGNLIDFRPQGISRTNWDYVYKEPMQLFDRTKNYLPGGYAVTFEFNKGTPILRVSSPKPIQAIGLDDLSNVNSLSGGWIAAGIAGSLTTDQVVYYNQPPALRFTLTGVGSGYVEKTIQSNDLTDYQGIGVVFVAIYTPSATNLTSLEVRIGSSSANYYAVTATTGFLGAWVANDWTLVSFDLSTATTVGSPTITAMDYVRITATTTATLTNFRIGELFIALPSPHELIYQTAAIFMASGSNPSRTITTDADTIILNDGAYNLLEMEAAISVAEQSSSGQSNIVADGYKRKLYGNGGSDIGLYAMYRADNPSQELRTVDNYY